MPWLSVTGICMRSCSQSTEMIFLIECKLVIAAFCLNQLREVQHQTEKYCRFKTRTYCVLRAVTNKFSAYFSTFSDPFLDVSLFWFTYDLMLPNKCFVKITKLLRKWNLFLLSFPFPNLTTFIASLRVFAQCLRKHFWVIHMAGGMLQLQCPLYCRLSYSLIYCLGRSGFSFLVVHISLSLARQISILLLGCQ